MRARASIGVLCAGKTSSVQYRWHGTGHHHRYLNDVRQEQTEGTDTILQVKHDTQMWLNQEQWDGYSDTYLKRWMTYQPRAEQARKYLEYPAAELNDMLEFIHKYYGAAADILLDLEEDPLHRNFHKKLALAKQRGEEFAAEIDKRYAGLHPTHKILYDAWCARRHAQLEDWYVFVERKRQKILERISPEFIRQQSKLKSVASEQIDKLKQLEHDIKENPALLLETSGWSEKEVELLKMKVNYFRGIKQYGKAQLDGDLHPY